MTKLVRSTRNRVRSTIVFTLVMAYTCQSRTGICASIWGISTCPTACQKTTWDRQNAESHCDWTNGRHSSTCCQSYMQQIRSWLTRNRVVRTVTMQTNSACSTVAHAIRFVVQDGSEQWLSRKTVMRWRWLVVVVACYLNRISFTAQVNCDLVEKTVTSLTLWCSSLRDCLWSHVDVTVMMVVCVCVLIKQNIVVWVFSFIFISLSTQYNIQTSVFYFRQANECT